MSIPLLVTKLHIPEPPVELVKRPQLLEQLNTGLPGRLTLISAPAGFGKTSLTGQWLRECGLPAAWVSLDEGDNDPVRFWSYMVAAMQTLYPAVGAGFLTAFTAPQPPPLEVMLTSLINELADIPQRFMLVLDDYHLIRAEVVHEGFTYLLDNSPETIHWVLATRADPPLPLARLRARRQMTEIRAEQMRFAVDESQELFNRMMGLALTPQETEILVGRTEGWAAGLQLAGLSLQHRQDRQSFIEAFAGSHQFILDYLMDEVLQRQPREMRTFLLRTSVLESLNAAVCADLLESTEKTMNAVPTRVMYSQEMLEQLLRENLFIIPLDDNRCWYRYHHLFADLLRAQLARLYPDLPMVLHQRASLWFEHHDDPRSAVKHAQAAGDVERIADLIESYGFNLLIQGELITILDWIGKVPEGTFCGRPWLYIYHAWALLLTRCVQESIVVLTKGEECLSGEPDNAQRESMQAHIATIRAFLAFMGRNVAWILPFAKQARKLLPAGEEAVSSILGFLEGGAYLTEGKTAEAFDAFLQAGDQGARSGNIHISVPATCSAAGICEMQGKPHQAEKIYRLGFQRAEVHGGLNSPLLARAYSGLCSLMYEWNQLDQAAEYALEGIRLEKMWGNLDSQVKNSLVLARVHLARGREAESLAAAEEAMQIVRTMPLSPGMAEYAWLYQMQIWLPLGMLTQAQQWMVEQGPSLDDEVSFVNEPAWFAQSLALAAMGEVETALVWASRLLAMVEASGWMGRVVTYSAFLGKLYWIKGDTEQALAAMQKALAFGGPEGYVRSFIDQGQEMRGLLRVCQKEGVHADYATALVANFPEEEIAHAEGPLSPREMEVLALLAEGKSNQEIAAELVVALSTVKRHIHNIYGKLEVGSRTQAVARGWELGLI